MYDTIVITTRPSAQLPDKLFTDAEVRQAVQVPRREAEPPPLPLPRVKLINNTAVDGVAMVYRRWMDNRDGGSLRLQFSVATRLRVVPGGNPRHSDMNALFDALSCAVSDWAGADLGHVLDWRPVRIDYAYNWEMASGPIIAALSGVTLPSLERRVYGTQSVLWSNRARAITLYDKAQSAGQGPLRYEYRLFRPALRRARATWFGCADVLREYLHPARAAYALAVGLDALGVNGLAVGTDAMLQRMAAAFGPRKARNALHAWHCITTYGTDTFHHLDYMSRQMYYIWRKRLLAAGFPLASDSPRAALPRPHVPLRPLLLSAGCADVVHNLEKNIVATQYPLSKNFWPDVAEMLHLARSAPFSRFFADSLQAEFERFSIPF